MPSVHIVAWSANIENLSVYGVGVSFENHQGVFRKVSNFLEKKAASENKKDAIKYYIKLCRTYTFYGYLALYSNESLLSQIAFLQAIEFSKKLEGDIAEHEAREAKRLLLFSFLRSGLPPPALSDGELAADNADPIDSARMWGTLGLMHQSAGDFNNFFELFSA